MWCAENSFRLAMARNKISGYGAIDFHIDEVYSLHDEDKKIGAFIGRKWVESICCTEVVF
jgi:hypothetical protein